MLVSRSTPILKIIIKRIKLKLSRINTESSSAQGSGQAKRGAPACRQAGYCTNDIENVSVQKMLN